ncbi:MAG: hypothetical protein NVS4B11_09810 [Ktedonobacteraceae bacterium]
MFITRYNNYKRLLFLLLTCSFLGLLVACGSAGISSGTSSAQSTAGNGSVSLSGSQGNSVSGGTTPVTTTVAMPTTQTSCPATGTGRAAVMAPLATSGNQTLVYVVNEGSDSLHPTAGTLKRLDIATGKKTEIVKLPTTYIMHAQLSTDGQWVLFVANANNVSKLQLVRMDGQGLQTLYCDTANASLSSTAVLWSNNQHTVVFSLYGPKGNISLLNLQTGSVQVELTTPMRVVTMLDNTRVYVAIPATDAPSSTLAILDPSKGSHQHTSDLTIVFQQTLGPASAYACWDADSSYDASTLFISQCTATASTQRPGLGTIQGPSTVGAQGATGGTLHTIFTHAQLALTGVRAVTAKTLLLQSKSYHAPYGTSQDGLWAIRTDGTGLVRLASQGILNSYAQTPWSNVSRDGTRYAFQTFESNSNAYTLGYGLLNGGTTTTFASITGTELHIVGWTTL